jgi:hypothetical protein
MRQQYGSGSASRHESTRDEGRKRGENEESGREEQVAMEKGEGKE